MAKYSEQILTNWSKPPSDNEQTKLENSARMVREAIQSDYILNKKSTEIFGQGSYANDTNVRLNSDIDINIRYTDAFYFDLPPNTTKSDVGIGNLPAASYTFDEFKNDVEKALVNKFGRAEVIRKDKCITILGNSYRVITDVVPTWNYRRYNDDGTYELGAKFFPDKSKVETVNFPKQHIENAKSKNANTSRRFKRLTRIHRKIRYKMIDDGKDVNKNITSFLIECLIWNVPDWIMNDYDTWMDRLKQSIIYLYKNTKEESTCIKWGEVSELLYLFHSGRKWSQPDVNQYMIQLWNYLELD